MDDESGDDNRDELTSEWGGESRHDWRGWRNESGSWFQRRGDEYLNGQGHTILWRWIAHKRLNIRPQLLWKANKKPHPSFRMVPVWVTFSDIFKVMIILRQITWKWYNIELYLQWPSNRKSYLSNGAIFNDLERPIPKFRGHAILWLWLSQKRTTCRHSVIEILIGTYTPPTQQCHFEWP